jgi:hypothetical protein
VLRDLAERRYHEYIRIPPKARPGKEIPYGEGDWAVRMLTREWAEFPALDRWLPPGLSVCSACGTVRGETPGPLKGGRIGLWTSTCLCGGPFCRRCRRNRIRRPISDYYDREDGDWCHGPSFAAMAGCRECDGGR